MHHMATIHLTIQVHYSCLQHASSCHHGQLEQLWRQARFQLFAHRCCCGFTSHQKGLPSPCSRLYLACQSLLLSKSQTAIMQSLT